MKNLMTGAAAIAFASALTAAPDDAHAQMRSPVPSGMQPRSTFTPPPGATVYRENQDGSSVQVSREEFERETGGYAPYQNNLHQEYDEREQEERNRQAYQQGYDATDYEARQRELAERSYARGPDDQIGCSASFNGGSWLNRGYGRWDRSLGRDGREAASVFGARGPQLTADAQARCRIDQIQDPEERARALGEWRRHQEERSTYRFRGWVRDSLGLDRRN